MNLQDWIRRMHPDWQRGRVDCDAERAMIVRRWAVVVRTLERSGFRVRVNDLDCAHNADHQHAEKSNRLQPNRPLTALSALEKELHLFFGLLSV